MNEKDIINRDIINDLVINYFGLDEESRDEFSCLLYNPEIDDIYKNYLGPDLRFRVQIEKENLEDYDEAWKLFRENFQTYVRDFSVSYRDFVRGRIFVDKNEFRIFKHLVSYYLESSRSISALFFDLGISKMMRNSYSSSNLLQQNINDVISMRLPSKTGFEIVLSLNFADWFLCSTSESWTSCLNLESDYHACYWSGIPGFIKDKNRAMIYITDGSKKNYKGIEVDKVLARSFLMLDDKDGINFLRWYPTDNFYESGVFEELPFKLKYIEDIYPAKKKIKYPVKPLFFNNGHSCFAYQDKTAFKYENYACANKERELFIVDKGGQFYINKNNPADYIEGGIFDYEGGFSGVVKSDLSFSDLMGNKCCNCGEIANSDFISESGNHYCESCYNDLFSYCNACDREIVRENIIFNSYGNYCEDCYEDLFVKCDCCGIDILSSETSNYTFEEEAIYCKRCYASQERA